MSAENESFWKRLPEVSQKFDIITSVAAIGLASLGIIPIGITVAFIGFNTVTYIGAEMIKGKKD